MSAWKWVPWIFIILCIITIVILSLLLSDTHKKFTNYKEKNLSDTEDDLDECRDNLTDCKVKQMSSAMKTPKKVESSSDNNKKETYQITNHMPDSQGLTLDSLKLNDCASAYQGNTNWAVYDLKKSTYYPW